MTSFWAPVSPVGCLWAVSRKQSCHTGADTSVYTSMPSCRRKHSGAEGENTHFKNIIYGKCAIFEVKYVHANKLLKTENCSIYRMQRKLSSEKDFWYIWCFGRSIWIYIHGRAKEPWSHLLEGLWPWRQKLLMYLAARGRQGGERTIVW